jgi:hypothetical protein
MLNTRWRVLGNMFYEALFENLCVCPLIHYQNFVTVLQWFQNLSLHEHYANANIKFHSLAAFHLHVSLSLLLDTTHKKTSTRCFTNHLPSEKKPITLYYLVTNPRVVSGE